MLRGLQFVNTAVVMRDKGQAVVTVPTGFKGFDTLEKGLQDAGFQATLIDPVHLTLKVSKADGVADLAGLATSFAACPEVAAAQPGEGVLAVYADPKLDPADLVAAAGKQGLSAEVSSHERLHFKVDGMECKMKETIVTSVLTGIPLVIGAGADCKAGTAWVLVEKGAVTPDAVEKALAAGKMNGTWCPKGHTECKHGEAGAAEGGENPEKCEHGAGEPAK